MYNYLFLSWRVIRYCVVEDLDLEIYLLLLDYLTSELINLGLDQDILKTFLENFYKSGSNTARRTYAEWRSNGWNLIYLSHKTLNWNSFFRSACKVMYFQSLIKMALSLYILNWLAASSSVYTRYVWNSGSNVRLDYLLLIWWTTNSE